MPSSANPIAFFSEDASPWTSIREKSTFDVNLRCSIINGTLSKTGSDLDINKFVITLATPIVPAFTFTIVIPKPGVPSIIFIGRSNLSDLDIYEIISLLSQIWFPVVKTSAPALKKSSQIEGVTPNPPAAFSTFIIIASSFNCILNSAIFFCAKFLAFLPTMSPKNKTFINSFF